MDDEAVLLARQVAMAASAWRHAKADTEAYRRLVVAVGAWDAYVAPTLDDSGEDGVADRLRRAARRALGAMDAEAARLAGQVAASASTWLRDPTDTEAYRRFVITVDDWDDYAAPRLEEPAEELLDQFADDSAPIVLGDMVADVTAQIHESGSR